MKDWYKRVVVTRNPLEDHPDYDREMTLIVNCLDGYPAYVRGLPEDSYPSEPDQFDVLSATYEDDTVVPDEVLKAIDSEMLSAIMREPA